jgi:phosphohistidine phosphatase
MKTLFILRHGKAERPRAGLTDFNRALTPRGHRDAARAGEALVERFFPDSPGAVSAARRTRETAEAVGAAWDWHLPEPLPEGYLAPALFWLQTVNAWESDRATGLIIGHNPGVSDFIEYLTGANTSLPTAGLAEVQFPVSSWAEISGGCGELVSVWTPSTTFGT